MRWICRYPNWPERWRWHPPGTGRIQMRIPSRRRTSSGFGEEIILRPAGRPCPFAKRRRKAVDSVRVNWWLPWKKTQGYIKLVFIVILKCSVRAVMAWYTRLRRIKKSVVYGYPFVCRVRRPSFAYKEARLKRKKCVIDILPSSYGILCGKRESGGEGRLNLLLSEKYLDSSQIETFASCLSLLFSANNSHCPNFYGGSLGLRLQLLNFVVL